MNIGDLVVHTTTHEKTGNIGLIIEIENLDVRVKWLKNKNLTIWHALYELERLSA